jgi:hypothetical protein
MLRNGVSYISRSADVDVPEIRALPRKINVYRRPFDASHAVGHSDASGGKVTPGAILARLLLNVLPPGLRTTDSEDERAQNRM